MATVGVVIASAVAAEAPTSPPVETAADVLMLPIVEAAHPQRALAAVAAPTAVRQCVAPMPQQRVETRPMVRLMPEQLVVGRPMAPPMPQQRIVADHTLVEGDRTAEVADRMAVANIANE